MMQFYKQRNLPRMIQSMRMYGLKEIIGVGLFISILSLYGCAGNRLVVSPTNNGVALGDTVKFIVKNKCARDLKTYLDDTEIFPEWQAEAYSDRWISDIGLSKKGSHTLRIEGQCESRPVNRTIHFRNDLAGSIEIADLVLSHTLPLNEPETLSWGWVSAIFLYPVARIAALSDNQDIYLDYVRRYHQHYMAKGTPPLTMADTCPPALSAYHLKRAYSEDFAMPNVEAVIEYIKTVERNDINSIDHLGDNIESFLYPSSIWVDSLMMWVLISIQYGLDTADLELIDFALPQPQIFTSRLTDPESGLLFHAWNIPKNRILPKSNTPWLRGNGWVLASLIEMISELESAGAYPEYYTAYCDTFVSLAHSILSFRQPSGYWDTVILDPGYAYEESSGSALVAYAFAKGARLGLLGPEFRGYAKDTFRAIVARMKNREDGYSMEEISVGTNPFAKWAYKLVPTSRDVLYGVGAFLLLAEEFAQEEF